MAVVEGKIDSERLIAAVDIVGQLAVAAVVDRVGFEPLVVDIADIVVVEIVGKFVVGNRLKNKVQKQKNKFLLCPSKKKLLTYRLKQR